MEFSGELFSIVRQSITITLFVLSMMLIIEYLNVLTKGLWSKKLKTSKWKQIILAAILGAIPGCLGAYTAVSLYVHNIIGTAALATALIATSGDEAFFMFSIIPETAILIQVAIFIIAIVAGFIINLFVKKSSNIASLQEKHLQIHEEEVQCFCFSKETILSNFKKPSFLRLSIISVFILSLLGIIFFSHGDHGHHFEILTLPEMVNAHPKWIKYTYIVVLSLTIAMLFTVNDHFLNDHLWGHIIRKHFVRIILWTFGTLLLMHFLNHYLDLDSIIGDNLYLVLLIAILVGIIPESGPHLIFLLLFANGTIPLSILLANSIVQDGHGSIPLLAETRKGFIQIKLINILVGLVVGVAGIMAGF